MYFLIKADGLPFLAAPARTRTFGKFIVYEMKKIIVPQAALFSKGFSRLLQLVK
jgi:hypothetical protein